MFVSYLMYELIESCWELNTCIIVFKYLNNEVFPYKIKYIENDKIIERSKTALAKIQFY